MKNQTLDPHRPASDLSQIGLEAYAPYLMNRIMGRYNADLRGAMGALGLTTAKMRALAILAVKDGLPIMQLGIFAVVEQSTLSRALDGLLKDGLVTRRTDKTDHRSAHIHLTEAGRAAYAQLWPKMKAAHDQMFEDIPDQDREQFLSTLNKMLANIRQHDL